MIIYHNVTIDLARAEAGISQPNLMGTEGDSGTHVLKIQLLQDGQPWPVPQDAGVLISYARTDGTGGTYDTLPDGSPAWYIQDGLVYAALAPACFSVATLPQEEIQLTVTLLHGNKQLTTQRIGFTVQRSLIADGEESDVYISFASVISQYIGDPAKLNTDGKTVVEAINETLEKFGAFTVCGIAPDKNGNVALTAAATQALPIYGGSMDGPIDMRDNELTGLCDPTVETDAVSMGWLERRLNGRNLLDNWYFYDPVNQRGATFYCDVGPCIDRWNIASTIELTLTDDGLDICLPEKNGRLEQFLECPMSLNGQTVTATTLLTYNDGSFIIGLDLIRDGQPISLHQISTRLTGPVSFTYTFGSQQIREGDRLCLYFGNADSTGGSYILAAVKLETGSRQTLARMEKGQWVLNEIPDHTAQLMNCQRFFQVFRTESLRPVYAEDFRPPMRWTPVLSTLVRDGVTYYTASAEL